MSVWFPAKFKTTVVTVLILAGCASGPQYTRPPLDIPEKWVVSGADSQGETLHWWTLYQDPTLNSLLDEALANNIDVQIALARVQEARARAGITNADRFPVVTGTLQRNRTKDSELGTFPRPEDAPRIQSSTRATFDASYEIDLWGRLRQASAAAYAELLATDFARQAVMLSLTTEVAKQYYGLLAASERLAVLEQVAASREESRSILDRRLSAGTVSEYEVKQADAETAAVHALIARERLEHSRAESALALLLGRSPRAVIEQTIQPGAAPAQTLVYVPAGLPSSLLDRRPDVREAEQRLIASQARVEEARAAFFPSVVLTGYLGSESRSFADLFTGPAAIFQLAAAVTQPIFNASRLTHARDAAEARRDIAVAQYRQTVSSAFRDVRNALAAQDSSRLALRAETRRADALETAYSRATLRYEGGIASRLEVLDADRQLLDARLAQIDARRTQREAVADLIKALGGGWVAPKNAAAPQSEDASRP